MYSRHFDRARDRSFQVPVWDSAVVCGIVELSTIHSLTTNSNPIHGEGDILFIAPFTRLNIDIEYHSLHFLQFEALALDTTVL